MTDDSLFHDADTIKSDKFTVGGVLSAQDVFVDGMSQFLFGFPVSKILLHTVVKPGEHEIRKAVISVAMPTATVIQMAQMILTNAIQNKEQLLTMAKTTHPNSLEALLSNASPAGDSTPKPVLR